MHRSEIEDYFTRRQREVLIIQRLDPWCYRIITKPDKADEDHDKAVWGLRQQGWSIAALSRLIKESWEVANRMVRNGEKKIEAELSITIEKPST